MDTVFILAMGLYKEVHSGLKLLVVTYFLHNVLMSKNRCTTLSRNLVDIIVDH